MLNRSQATFSQKAEQQSGQVQRLCGLLTLTFNILFQPVISCSSLMVYNPLMEILFRGQSTDILIGSFSNRPWFPCRSYPQILSQAENAYLIFEVQNQFSPNEKIRLKEKKHAKDSPVPYSHPHCHNPVTAFQLLSYLLGAV